MKKSFLAITIFMFLFSCTDTDSKSHREGTDSAESAKRVVNADTNEPAIKIPLQKTNELAAKILGTWAMLGEENASFVIDKSKITYPETFSSYKYILTSDSIKIHYDDYVGSYFVKMKGSDTLILTGEEEQVYRRFKE